MYSPFIFLKMFFFKVIKIVTPHFLKTSSLNTYLKFNNLTFNTIC